MIKVMILIKRKAGISREEFIDHYENVHVPLGLKYFPMIKGYMRNYVVNPPGVAEPDFDCITEEWFENMEEHLAAVDFWRSEAAQVVRDDEDRFMDSSKTAFFVVEEKITR